MTTNNTRNMSPESVTLLKLLDDGVWHHYEQTVQRLATTVPPGKALRKWEALRAAMDRRLGPRQSPEPSDDEKIASGQRTWAVAAFNAVKDRHLEFRGEGVLREVRRRPIPLVLSKTGEMVPVCGVPEHQDLEQRVQEALAAALGSPERSGGTSGEGPKPCDRCGFYVANWDTHEDFHERFDKFVAEQPEGLPEPREMGLVDENAMRVLVRQEVDAALDGFQRGMQAWLIERFAALEEVLGQRIPTPEDRQRINRRR